MHEVKTAPRLLLLLWLLAALAVLCPRLSQAAEDYLEPEAAFKFSARMADEKTIEVRYQIAPGYYMYRERFAFRAEGAQLGQPEIPPGKVKFDETFKKEVETYRDALTIRIPVVAENSFKLIATSQGCADRGLCYTPMDSEAKLSPKGGGGLWAALQGGGQGAAAPASGSESSVDSASPGNNASNANSAASSADVASSGEMGRIESSLKSGKLALIVPLFILLGLGLAFTPCVLPMVPILSSIIVGEGKQASRARSFSLALAYSLGMALVYTALGVAAGLISEGLSASLQKPWVLITFALLMVGLSLSMFGLYQLQMPASWQTRLAQSSGQAGGKYAGVFLMGGISALIVGPCVAAPLAGVLVYISQTRDVLVGGVALFSLAMGMSIPLLLVGLSAGMLLPRAGLWMDTVKRFFGVIMLAMAVWMVTPVVPAWLVMLAWAILGVAAGIWLLRPGVQRGWGLRALGVLVLLAGAVQAAGLASGGRDPLAPLAHVLGTEVEPEFQTIRSSAELDLALQNADGRVAMLDFYADWCVSCKEMEKFVFSKPEVKRELDKMLLLRIDVTANNADDRAMLKRFGLFGPPGILFFGNDGQEIRQTRVIGYQAAPEFRATLSRLMLSPQPAL